MRTSISVAAAIALLGLSVAAAQQKRKTVPATAAPAPVKKGAAPAAHKSTSGTTAKKGATSSGTARHTASSRKSAPKAPPPTWRNRQTVPSPDRYREIQDALASRGYLRPEDVTGSWNQSSVDALKRFQREQNLESSGKINSLSLIAMGLGPKRDSAPAVPAPAPDTPPPAR